MERIILVVIIGLSILYLIRHWAGVLKGKGSCDQCGKGKDCGS